MKFLDTLEAFGEACKSTTLSNDYNVTLKLNTPQKESKVILRTAGVGSVKVLKLAASAAIVAGGTIIANKLKSK